MYTVFWEHISCVMYLLTISCPIYLSFQDQEASWCIFMNNNKFYLTKGRATLNINYKTVGDLFCNYCIPMHSDEIYRIEGKCAED